MGSSRSCISRVMARRIGAAFQPRPLLRRLRDAAVVAAILLVTALPDSAGAASPLTVSDPNEGLTFDLESVSVEALPTGELQVVLATNQPDLPWPLLDNGSLNTETGGASLDLWPSDPDKGCPRRADDFLSVDFGPLITGDSTSADGTTITAPIWTYTTDYLDAVAPLARTGHYGTARTAAGSIVIVLPLAGLGDPDGICVAAALSAASDEIVAVNPDGSVRRFSSSDPLDSPALYDVASAHDWVRVPDFSRLADLEWAQAAAAAGVQLQVLTVPLTLAFNAPAQDRLAGSRIGRGQVVSMRIPRASVAVVRNGRLYAASATLSRLVPLTGRGIATAAFDRDGSLWYARGGGPNFSGCSIHRLGSPRPLLSGSQITATTGAGGGCAIWGHPQGGLLVETDNGTAASGRVWHLDTETRRIELVSHGYDATLSPDGSRLVVVRHTYLRGGGAYEALFAGGSTDFDLRRMTGQQADYSFPRFSPDGGRLAVAVRRRVRPGVVILNRRLDGARTVMQVPPYQYVAGLEWAPSGRTLFVTVAGRRSAATYELDPARGTLRRRLTAVSWVATNRSAAREPVRRTESSAAAVQRMPAIMAR
jgi:hypothetical protein